MRKLKTRGKHCWNLLRQKFRPDCGDAFKNIVLRYKQIALYISYFVFTDTSLSAAMVRHILRGYNNATATNMFDDMKQYLKQIRNVCITEKILEKILNNKNS